MAKPTRIAHIVLMTRRYDEMIAWYGRVFEADIVHSDPALTFMSFDEESHRFAIVNLDVTKPGGNGKQGDIGVNHVAFTYDSAADVLENYERLKADGIEPYWPIHHGMTLSLYYRDPDGNRLELQADTIPLSEGRPYMTSPAFAANPIGVEFDPQELLNRYRQGADEADLLRPPEGTPSGIPADHGLVV